MPRVAVVTPVFNKIALTLRFLESFTRVDYSPRTIIIVDDGSTDNTREILAEQFPEVIVLRGDGNLWWSGCTNRGVRRALEMGHDYVLTINNDVIVRPDFLSRLVATARAHPRSLVGARINFLEEPGKIWAVGASAHWDTDLVMQCNCQGGQEDDIVPRLHDPSPVQALTGCGALIPASCYREVGFYDDRWFPQYHGDSEFALRAARHGYRIFVDLKAVVFNNSHNTSSETNIFSRRSPWFWRPLLGLRLRHCPRRRMVGNLRAYGAWFFQQVRLQTRRAIKKILPRWLLPASST